MWTLGLDFLGEVHKELFGGFAGLKKPPSGCFWFLPYIYSHHHPVFDFFNGKGRLSISTSHVHL